MSWPMPSSSWPVPGHIDPGPARGRANAVGQIRPERSERLRGNGRVRRDKLSGVTRPVPEIRNLGNDFSLRLRRIAS